MAKQLKTIAVIDDDLDIRQSMEALLTAFDYRVELYASAEEFVTALPATDAAALLLDIQLPDLTGIELTRHLLAEDLKFPTVFMTGSRDPTLRRQALEFGCVAFLEKPFGARQLIEALATATGSNPFFEQ